MRKRALLAPAIGFLTVLLVVGCTQSAPGEATPEPGGSTSPQEQPSSSSTTSGGASPTVEIPPRPREITLDDLDPCTLFTPEQRTQLQANDVDSGTSGSDRFEGMKECVLSVDETEPYYEYYALAVTSEGIEEWLSGTRNVEAELTSIGEFPAATFHFLGVEDEGCEYAVSVADNQYLWVGMLLISRGFTQDQICQMSQQAAEMAIATLQTLR